MSMANLRPIQPMMISARVYEAIESAVVQCELKPGAAIGDRQLAEMLNVSRTPVRDALHQLESTGLIRRQGRSGWVVAGFEEKDVHELFEVRRVLEQMGLRRLADHWDEETVERLAGFFDGFPDHLPREMFARYLERDRDFHKQIVACSGNSRVIHFYSIVEKQIDRVRHFLSTGYKGRIDEVHQEHRELCVAIAGKDAEASIAALVHHLNMGEETMISFVREGALESTTGESA
jgi:DNA-binding GntR family transcriptional regulator